MRKIAGYLTKNRNEKDKKIAQSTHEKRIHQAEKNFFVEIQNSFLKSLRPYPPFRPTTPSFPLPHGLLSVVGYPPFRPKARSGPSSAPPRRQPRRTNPPASGKFVHLALSFLKKNPYLWTINHYLQTGDNYGLHPNHRHRGHHRFLFL